MILGKDIFSIGEFATFARTTRDTLVYYDKIGLLSPATRGENNYRYYSLEHLAMFNLIRTSQALGMPLDEVKQLRDDRTPELMDVLLDNQVEKINDEIDKWVRARKLLFLFKSIINSYKDIDESEISIMSCPAEAIILGELNDYRGGKNDFDALLAFYHDMYKKYPGIDLNYPVWAFFSEERIKNRDWKWPDRFYFYNPEGHDKKPADLYAVGYTRGGYGQTGELYERLLDHIEENGYEICGPTYEEYPLNEIFMKVDSDYLVRIMITVRKK